MNFNDMTDQYLKRVKEQLYLETDLYRRGILKDFALFMNKLKGDDWDIKEITKNDLVQYHFSSEKVARSKSIKVINHFMRFAENRGWIDGYSCVREDG